MAVSEVALLSDEEMTRILLEVAESLSTTEVGGATEEQLLAGVAEVQQWVVAEALLRTWRARKLALYMSDVGTVGVRLMPPKMEERLSRLDEDSS